MVMCSCITGLKMCLTLQTVEDQHLGYVNIMSALVQCVLLILWYCTIVCVSMRCLCTVTLPLSVCFTKQLNNAVMSLRLGNCQWCAILCVKRGSTIHVSNQDILRNQPTDNALFIFEPIKHYLCASVHPLFLCMC